MVEVDFESLRVLITGRINSLSVSQMLSFYFFPELLRMPMKSSWDRLMEVTIGNQSGHVGGERGGERPTVAVYRSGLSMNTVS